MKKHQTPTINELIENDPRFAATVAAIRFEADEADRHQKKRSFIWRHNGVFFRLGFLMVATCLVLIFTVLPSQDLADPDIMPQFYGLMGLGFGGMFLILLTLVMSEARNVFTGAAKVIGVIMLTLMLAVPGYIGLHAVLY